MSTPKMKKGLGRGLNALFQDEEDTFENDTPTRARATQPAAPPVPANTGSNAASSRFMVSVSSLVPGAFQPRQNFDEEALNQLADSIRQHGLLQPLLVRKDTKKDGQFEIIAGERRWRAAQRAQLHEVPVVVANLEDAQAAEVALIENLQREDLNAVEEALGYKRLADEYGHTQEKLAKVIGKSRPHIANTMRLLQLPPAILDYVRQGKLSAGHARALITSKDPLALAQEVIAKNLSVRKTEELANEGSAGKAAKKGSDSYVKDADTIEMEKDLSNVLGLKVTIDPKTSTVGSVKIEYKNLDQLDDIVLRLARFPKKKE
ncbi:MAG: ParB/RepB/Spo0J family partition protein [Alphaproteobacteria bacterium]